MRPIASTMTALKHRSILAGGVIAMSLTATPGAFADDTAREDVTQHADRRVEQAQQAQMAAKRQAIIEEATTAIRETQNALKALDEGQQAMALAALEHATGKLELILAREPELALAPAGVNVYTYDVVADIEVVKEVREQAEDALDDGDVQKARRLISNLASETVIKTTNIPLATYPQAIREAVRLIDEEKMEQAKMELQAVLNTLVVTDTVIPLSVVTAEQLLDEAKTLARKADRSQQENESLSKLLKESETQLEFAEALGYGSEEDFENLYAQLENIEDKTESGQAGTGFFDEIEGFIDDAIESSQPEESAQASR